MTEALSAIPAELQLRSTPYQLLIDGSFRVAAGGESIEVTSPRDGQVIAGLASPSPSDIDAALSAARRAADRPEWRWSNARTRADLLLRWRDRVADHADELAYLEAVDTGKPLRHITTNDLPIALESLEYFAAQTRAPGRPSYPLATADAIHHPLAEPMGVVVELLPWNGPIWTGVQRVAGLIATGNTAVVKPSEYGSLVFARLIELLVDAGLPSGVVNVVYGGPEVGEALITDPRVDLISLTGGTRTGRRVLELAAHSIKQVSLELGGKNPFVVLADADVDSAVTWAGIASFANSGQICISPSRFLVDEPVYEEFVEKFEKAASRVSVGDPLDAGSEMGTVINAAAADRIWGVVSAASADARLIAGGLPYEDGLRSQGAFVPPTIFADVPRQSQVACDEIFGPVAAVCSVRGLQDAVKVANNSRYGLSAGVFTSDLNNAWTLARAIRAGEIYVNRWFSPGVLEAPVEGYKQSGVGRAGMEKYLRSKNVFFNHEIAAEFNQEGDNG